MKRIIVSLFALSVLSCPAYSSGLIRVGFDWFDAGGVPAFTDMTNVYGYTSMNVVHTLAALNSPACANYSCAIGVSAGSNEAYLNICPGAASDTECMNMNSYQNIWSLVNDLKNANNQPSAIYFIDEPFDNQALGNGGAYTNYRYPSYVCTLHDAMDAYGVSYPVFTILSYRQATQVPQFINEIRNGLPPQSTCGSGVSKLDWVGIDNYSWTESSDIVNTYRGLLASTGIRWVVVPPAFEGLINPSPSDSTWSSIIASYQDAADQGDTAAIMYFRYSPAVLSGSSYPKTACTIKKGTNMGC